ncbi:MAG: glycosyltransferase family 39 protein [Thermoanaerobaculia bacterium]
MNRSKVPPEDRQRPGDRRLRALLVVLLLASLALTAWYASWGLHRDRYWDERFSMENVAALLLGDSFRPANGYYQSLSYLPQTALLGASETLHRWTGWESLAVFDEEQRFTATAYLLARLLQALYGAGCLLVTFLLGRSLFGPGVGLLGAFLLAVTPWHVQVSSMFKPDVLLTLGVLLATWWSVRAVEHPTPGRFALAGAGVALAASAKLNGLLAAAPLVVAAVLANGAWRRRGLRLSVSAVACAGLFVVLNPWFPMYTEAFGENLDHYTYKAGTYGGTRLGVLWQEAALIASPAVHGRVLGGVALIAVAVFAVHLFRARSSKSPTDRARGGRFRKRGAAGGWVLLSFPLSYSLTYAAATPHFKANNFLPLFPFTALLAAWGLSRLWRSAADRWPTLRRQKSPLLAGALLVTLLAPRPALYAYRQAVPTTEELAWRFLRTRFRDAGEAEARLVFAERAEVADASLAPPSPPDLLVAGAVVERLARVEPVRLGAADGEVFPAVRLQGEDSDAYWLRLTNAPRGAVRRFTGEAFVARGPDRIAVAHPWRRTGPPLELEVRPPSGEGSEEAGWRLRLPSGLGAGERVSFLVVGRGLGTGPRLESGMHTHLLALATVARPRAAPRYVSERITVAGERPELRLVAGPDAAPGAEPVVELLRWLPPENGG